MLQVAAVYRPRQRFVECRIRLCRNPDRVSVAVQPAGNHADVGAARRHRRGRRIAAAAHGPAGRDRPVLKGFIFVAILASDTMHGRIAWFQPRAKA